MSVNKVGRTLLLDKFDVEKLLSQAAQVSTRVAEQCVIKSNHLEKLNNKELNIIVKYYIKTS